MRYILRLCSVQTTKLPREYIAKNKYTNMLQRGYLRVFWEFARLGAFFLVSRLFSSVQNVIWWLNGTERQIRKSRKHENYSSSAQVLNVWYTYRIDFLMKNRLADYILSHDHFTAPEYVLRDEVNLLQVTENEAIFVQNAKNTPPHFNFPFTNIGLTLSPEKIIIMPLESLDKLVRSMDKLDAKIIFLHNTTRCGGTLCTNIFKETGRCVTLCEPHPINIAHQYYDEGRWSREHTKAVLRNVILMFCKSHKGLPQKPLAYVFKPTGPVVHCADLIGEAVPEAIQFFLYRDPLNVALSLRRVGDALLTFGWIYYVPNMKFISTFMFRYMTGVSYDGFQNWAPKSRLDIMFGYRVACLCTASYLRVRKTGTMIRGIRYDVLRDHAAEITAQMFDICDLPKDLVTEGLKALDQDSQGGSVISRENIKKLNLNLSEIAPAVVEEARQMSKELGVPGPDDGADFVLDGSLMP